MANRTQLRIADCRVAVQVRYRIARDEIFSSRRFFRHAHPRQVAMLLAHELTGASTTLVGKHFGRHHTTVLHAKRSVQTRAAKNEAYAQDLEDMRLTLRVYAAQIVQANWPEGMVI